MGLKSVHIPFATGQNEGIDEKLLPDGQFRSVENFFLQRDGRMARRYNPEVKVSDGSTVEAFVDGGYVATVAAGNERKVGTWAFVADEERYTQLNSSYPEGTSVTRYAEHNPMATDVGTYGASCDTLPDGTLVTVSLSSSQLVVSVRDPETFKEIATRRIDLSLTYFFVQVACSKIENKFAVVISTPGYRLFAFSFDTGITQLSDLAVSNNTYGDPGIAAIPGRDRFVICHWEAASSPQQIKGMMFGFDGTFTGSYYLAPENFGGVLPSTAAYQANGVINECRCDEFYLYVAAMCSLKDSVGNYYHNSLSLFRFPHPAEGANQESYVRENINSADIAAVNGGSLRLTCPSVLINSPGKFTVLWGGFTATPIGHPKTHMVSFDGVALSPIGVFPTMFPSSTAVQVGDSGYFAMEFFSRTGVSNPGGTYPDQYTETQGTNSSGMTHAARLDLADSYSIRSPQCVSILTDFQSSMAQIYNTQRGGPRRLFQPAATTIDGKLLLVYPQIYLNALATDDYYGDPNLVPAPRTASVIWSLVKTGQRRASKQCRANESIMSGGVVVSVDGTSTIHPPYFPPCVRTIDAGVGGGGPPTGDDITMYFCFLTEYRDANGRLWRSPPTLPITAKRATADTGVTYRCFIEACPWGGPPNSAQRVVLYQSNDNGSVLYRRADFVVVPGELYTFDLAALGLNSFSSSSLVEALYTDGGTVPNDPPPPCLMFARGRNRLWAAGTWEPGTVQASKILNESLGVEWSSQDQFKVPLPGEVTGIAAMDDAIVAFTRDGVFLVQGEGPDNTGVGFFSEPQVIPASSGCISPESVVVSEAGVHFLSRRGLEVVQRGFSSPVWEGQAVRDILELYPVCVSSVVVPDLTQVRWLFVSEDRASSVVIVYDTRASAWSVFRYNESIQITGLVPKTDNGEVRFGFSTAGNLIYQESRTEENSPDSFIETGQLRTSGIQGWSLGRRVHVLGDWGGRTCEVTLAFAFGGSTYLPQDKFTWRLDSSQWSPGAVELQLTLPVFKFSAVQFKLTVKTIETDGEYSFKANGITLYYDTIAEGPRLGGRSRG